MRSNNHSSQEKPDILSHHKPFKSHNSHTFTLILNLTPVEARSKLTTINLKRALSGHSIIISVAITYKRAQKLLRNTPLRRYYASCDCKARILRAITARDKTHETLPSDTQVNLVVYWREQIFLDTDNLGALG